MNKLLFSFMACGAMMTFASCQNQDEPSYVETGTLTSSFPKGSVPTELTVEIPGDARTRADLTADLPLWDITQSTSGLITVRYGIYHADGSLYYCTDNADTPLTTVSGSFKLSIPLPANENDMKIFIWADKSNGSAYKIDWNQKKVSAKPWDSSSKVLYNTYAKDGDAFCLWDNIKATGNNISKTVILMRPFVQINVLSDELLNNEALAKSFIKTGYGSDFGLWEGNAAMIYIPSTWYWDDDTFEFQAVNALEELAPNRCFTYGQPNKGYFGTLNGVRKNYFGVFYFFAPRERKAWRDKTSGTEFTSFLARMINDENNNTSNIQISGDMPKMKANERLVIHNSNSGDGSSEGGGDSGSGGLLTAISNWNVSIISNYSSTNEP